MKDQKSRQGSGPTGSRQESLPDFDESGRRKDFSSWNREMRDQIDPETGERTQLLTKKQYQDLLKKGLKEF